MTQPLPLDTYNKLFQSVVLVNEDSYQVGMTLREACFLLWCGTWDSDVRSGYLVSLCDSTNKPFQCVVLVNEDSYQEGTTLREA